MANGQVKKDLGTRSSPPPGESSATRSEAELIGYIQQAFADKNSTLLLLERQRQEQSRVLAQLESEVAGLVRELHRTQESLERAWHDRATAEKNAFQQTKRIERLKKLLPGYWEMDLTGIKKRRKGPTEIFSWTIENAYIENDYIAELKLETHLTQGEVGVVIKHTATTNGYPWVTAYDKNEVRVFPENCPINEGRNSQITSLGSSDWRKTKEVIRSLEQLLENPEFAHPSLKQTEITGLQKGLAKLNKNLNEWPWVFRFDKVELNDTLQTHEYHRLSLRLFNLSVGDFSWPRLDYSVATVDHSEGFGQNPRLEFPESSKPVINNWFAETSDGRGSRLELRFAQPNAFDRDVWRQLTDMDHLLIAALISGLPTQLAAIEKQKGHTQDWQKWKELGRSMKTILASHLK